MKYHYKLLVAALICLTSSAAAQHKKPPAAEQPKLIVYIVVGNMRADYLHRFRRNFTTKGFRLFLNEGTICTNARYSHAIAQGSAGLATIVTGAQPAQHGIVGNSWHDRDKDKALNAAYDSEARDLQGGSRFPFSPKNLLTTTLSDELKLVSPNSRVFSVAMQAENAVILGGHSADAAFWWDGQRGIFTSNNYYMPSLPAWVNDFNDKNFAASYLTRTWTTLYPLRRYTAKPERNAIVYEQNGETFLLLNTNIPPQKIDYGRMPSSPFADNLVKDFVNTLIVNENLGQEAAADVLLVYFSGIKTMGGKHGLLSPELEDAVYRTDEAIKQFITFLQEYVGKERLVVVLTADRGAEYSQAELARSRLPHSTFESRRALILLKSYFKALYGKGEWIKAIHNRQVYFNRLHIEESGKNLQRMQEKGIEFLSQMSGVASVSTFADPSSDAATKNAFHPKRSGDLLIVLTAGSADDDDSAMPYNYNLCVPLCFYGARIPQRTIDAPIDMTSLAATIAAMIGTAPPAGVAIDVLIK